MKEAVVVALISGISGIVAGVWGRGRYGPTPPAARGDHGAPHLETVIARRADVEFQTRMTILMEGLTAAIEKGHEKASGQMAVVSEAITEAADAVRELHRQINEYREVASLADHAAVQTHQLVLDLHKRVVNDDTRHPH